MPVAQSTTFSSAASELDDSLEEIPRRSHKSLVLAAGAALVVVLGGVTMMKRKPAATTGSDGSKPAATALPNVAAPVATTAAGPATVTLRIDAEPLFTHVFRAAGVAGEPEDLGAVPLSLTVPRAAATREYILRAEGHKERAVRLDTSHDRALHVKLDALPAAATPVAAEKRPAPPATAVKRPPARGPAKPVRRSAIHDADGLAVPSF
jgi:hypothetical protein